MNVLSSPIFFIGMPRSGTTIVFEAFARHPRLAWLTNLSESFPGFPWLNVVRRLHDNSLIGIQGRKRQYAGKGLGNILVRPDEAYHFWDRYTEGRFSRNAFLGEVAANEVIRLLRKKVRQSIRAQGKQRFSTKLTGPGRIAYLASIFPDAKFVHVVRDGRAVVHSLLRVDFWEDKGGFDGPFWHGLVDEVVLADWEKHGRNPGVIAAHEWNCVVDSVKAESGEAAVDVMEVRYEDFIDDPHGLVRNIYEHCKLKDSQGTHDYIDSNVKLVNMNHKYVGDWTDAYIGLLTDIMRERLVGYDYLT